MKFGKLPSLEGVNFSLPPDPPGNSALFQKLQEMPRPEKPRVYIGGTGWVTKEWVGKIYPKGTKSQDYLYHYSRQFDTIELNTTYYRIPDLSTIEKWYGQSAEDFRFCPKIPQTISHSGNLGLGTGLTLQFCESVANLHEKLGCCFLQLPPHFGPNKLAVLENYVKHFPVGVPLAVEARHEDWFNDGANFNRLFGLLEEYHISPVVSDVSGRRDVLHMRLTTELLLVRFVGHGLHPTDYTRIDDWVRRLTEWFDQGLTTVYFFVHEPKEVLTPEMAIYLAEKLQKTAGIETRIPVILSPENKGEQMSLF